MHFYCIYKDKDGNQCEEYAMPNEEYCKWHLVIQKNIFVSNVPFSKFLGIVYLIIGFGFFYYGYLNLGELLLSNDLLYVVFCLWRFSGSIFFISFGLISLELIHDSSIGKKIVKMIDISIVILGILIISDYIIGWVHYVLLYIFASSISLRFLISRFYYNFLVAKRVAKTFSISQLIMAIVSLGIGVGGILSSTVSNKTALEIGFNFLFLPPYLQSVALAFISIIFAFSFLEDLFYYAISNRIETIFSIFMIVFLVGLAVSSFIEFNPLGVFWTGCVIIMMLELKFHWLKKLRDAINF
jgi:hypothetical protein